MATLDEMQRLLSQNRQEIGTRVAELPRTEENIRANLFGGDKTLASLRQNQETKIMELFEHDKRIAERYANPQSEAYLQDPYMREVARANQFQGTVGELSQLQSQTEARRDVLGDTLDKALKLAQYGVQAKQIENQLLQQEFENELNKQKLSGGSGTLDELLSISELKELGLPYGATRRQAMGITPRSLAGGLDPAKLQKEMGQVQTAELILNQVEQRSQSTAKGRLPGNLTLWWHQNIGSVPGVSEYENLRKAMLGPLARAVSQEVGVLNEGDIQRAEGLIPKITDDPQEALAKIEIARNLINERKNLLAGGGMMTAQSSGGVRPKLKDPSSGSVYEYDSFSDPDYQSDRAQGFIPQ